MSIQDIINDKVYAIHSAEAHKKVCQATTSNFLTRCMDIFKSYGDLSKLNICKTCRNLELVVTDTDIRVYVDGGVNKKYLVLPPKLSKDGTHVEWVQHHYLNNGTAVQLAPAVKTLEAACEAFFAELLTLCRDSSILEFAKTVPKPYHIKCLNCGNTNTFYATATITQRVEIDQNYDIQEGLDTPDYNFDDVVCPECGCARVVFNDRGQR